MVHASFLPPHGAHAENTTRHTITAELAAMLAAARRRRGWALREAARNVGVAVGTIVHLEKARRAPSVVVAQSLIRAYRLNAVEADMLLAEAIEGAGKDSPYRHDARRTGRLSMETAACGVFFGARQTRP